MTEKDLLELIGKDGAYSSEIPNDDDTNGILSECFDKGLVTGKPSRIDDFFSLTAKGLRVLNVVGTLPTREDR